MIDARAAFPPRLVFVSLSIGAYAALVAIAPTPRISAMLVAPLLLAAVAWWTLAHPHRWIIAFLVSAVVLPPLPIPMGDSGPHPALLFAAFGVFAGVLYLREWRIQIGLVECALLALFAILFASTALAALYSGGALALQTVMRVLLFAVGVYVYFFTAFVGTDGAGPRIQPLVYASMASAAIACLDFYYQLPAPAGFSHQFVWLESGEYYRRAQGIFYEASTLGNFCACFLVMISVALTRPRRQTFVPRFALVAGGVLFSAALLFSYSRSSIVNLIAAFTALAWIDRRRIAWRQALPWLAFSVAAAAAAGFYFLPQLVEAAWMRLSGSVLYFFDYGEAIFSGRFDSWRFLLRFLAEHPWHAILGVGYKTLPYSEYIGQRVIGDNMYLSMLVETGIVGLCALLWLHAAVLRASFRAARHPNALASFLGTWMFCFWTGQVLQMFSADLLTYWRVLPVYFFVLAWAVRASRQSPAR